LLILSFELAFKYRNPVMMLSDGAIGQMMEKVYLSPRKRDQRLSPNGQPQVNLLPGKEILLLLSILIQTGRKYLILNFWLNTMR
jgi:pyruvate/2-oxoacid:ferredoxin oxidoreductase alpha subunit